MPASQFAPNVQQPLYDQSFSSAAPPNTGPILLYPAIAIFVVVTAVTLTGGASPTLQLDAVEIFPDASATTIDYYNNGGHNSGTTFSFVFGPVAGANHARCPGIFQLNPVIAGGPTNVAYRITIFRIL